MKQNHTIREIIHELEARVRSNRRWRVVATCLASVVVFTTVYLLVLPAITIQTSDDLSGAGIELTSVEDSQGSVTNSGVQPLAEGDVTSGDVTSGDVPADDTSSATQPGSDGGASTGDGGTTGDSATTDDGAAANDGTQDVSQPSGSTGETTPQPEGGSSVDVAGEATPNQPASNDGAETLSSGDDASTVADITDTVIVEGTIEGTALTWVITENDLGERTLTVEGDGAIPDYNHTTTTPWYNQALKKLTNIVIGDGVTAIGRNAFSSLYATGGLTIGKNVTTIGANALDRNNFSEPIVIPGNVVEVGSKAFRDWTRVPELTFEANENGSEQKISSDTLENAMAQDGVVSFSSTMTQIYASSCNASKYNVEGGNKRYGSIEGILYLRNMDLLGRPDGTYTLIKYPAYKDAAKFIVPASVTEIQSQAFANVYRLTRLEIPDKVNDEDHMVKVPSGAFRSSKIQEIYLGSRTQLTNLNDMFAWNNNLRKVTISPEVNVGTSLSNAYNGDSLLEEGFIQSTITNIGQNDFAGCISLYRLTYDAANVTSFPTSFGAGRLSFTLVIGEHVDTIGQGFDIIGRYASGVLFEPNNTITVDEGAFANLPDPLRTISGATIYVDTNGLVYTLDEGDHTAALVYVPPTSADGEPVTSVTIPGAVSPDNGQEYAVDTVRRDSLRNATNLEALTFDSPESIVLLETNALANCPSLKSVNGETSASGARKIFNGSGVTIGYGIFNNTGLEGAESGINLGENMKGPQSLVVSDENAPSMNISLGKQGPTLSWSADGSSSPGGWKLLTGDALNLQISLGDTGNAADHVYRVFIHYTRDSHSLTPAPGTYTYNDIPTTCYATSDPYTYCIEFRLTEDGQTVNIPLVLSYNNGSAGGGAMVWGEIDTQALDEKDQVQDGNIVDANEAVKYPEDETQMLYAFWSTQPDIYNVTKEPVVPDQTVELASDGKGGGTIAEPLQWYINFKRDDATNESEFGKDYATYYEMSGSIDLPEHVEWTDKVAKAMADGNVLTDVVNTTSPQSMTSTLQLEDGTRILSVSSTGTAKGLEVTDIEGEDPEFSFYYTNVSGTPVGTSEISYLRWTVTVYPEALYINLNDYATSKGERAVTNKVTNTVHYNYADPHTSIAESTINLGESDARLSLTKNGPTTAYLGEDIDYTLTLKNEGAVPWEGTGASGGQGADVYRVVDTLSKNTYIKPENIEKLFNTIPAVPEASELVPDASKEITLEVKIDNATLATWQEVHAVESVVSEDGSKKYKATYQTAGNSDDSTFGEGKVTSGHTLVITKPNPNTYSLKVDDKGPVADGSIAQLLRDAGYDVTSDAQYTCTWYLNTKSTCFYLLEGGTVKFSIPASAKTSFEVITDDWWHEYDPNEVIGAVNNASVTSTSREDSGPWAEDAITTELRREARVDKWASRNGEALGGEMSVGQGDILDYQVDFRHYGTGSYDHLPFVDDIYGTQALLVPVKGNENNQTITDINPKTYDDDGTEYYILSEPGKYKDVLVGVDDKGDTWNAAIINVTSEPVTIEGNEDLGFEGGTFEGRHTEIKWYHESLPGEEYQIYVRYRTIVDVSLAEASAGELDIANIIWINDRTDRRIYDVVYGGGSIIAPEKDIVTSLGKEDDPSDDTTVEEGHSVVHSGEAVTYRLTLDNYNSTPFTVVGTAMADALPKTYGVFDWTRGGEGVEPNVEVKFVAAPGSGAEATGIEDWFISDKYEGGGLASDDGQTYLCWPKETTIELPAHTKAYIYVTLQFPGGEDDIATWNRYTDATGGATLENTYWLYRQSARVTHEVHEPGYVALQKGVYSTIIAGTQTSGRDSYSNSADKKSGVVYYLMLFNAGNKRLYLNEVQDTLPAGFTYSNLVKDRATSFNVNAQAIVTIGGNQSEDPADSVKPHALVDCKVHGASQPIVFRSATVTATGVNTGEPRFAFSEGTGDYAVKSDELGCYLERNEAIVFAYTCYTDVDTTKTPDSAENKVGMPYTDYLNSGMFAANSSDAKEAGIDVLIQGYQGQSNNLTFNKLRDGEYSKVDHSVAAGDGYGFSVNEGDERDWLVSDIDLDRGGIKPGISKDVVSYREQNSETDSEYTNSVSPTSTINWAIRGYNEGTQIISNYTFTDSMPSPYTFVGEVYMNVYDRNGNYVFKDTSGALFEIKEHEPESAFITFVDRNGNEIEVEVDGPGDSHETSGAGWYRITSDTLHVKVTRGEHDEEVLHVRFSYYGRGVPGNGCYAELKFSSKNATGDYDPTVVTNTATFSPNVQDFDETSAGQGIFLKGGGEDGKNAMQASASINISLGSSTSSIKEVAEIEADGSTDENTATSQDEKNGITLSSPNSTFRYALEVTNESATTDLEKLILIDNLPQVGDASPFEASAKRGSEFNVALANGNFTVEAFGEDGTPLHMFTREGQSGEGQPDDGGQPQNVLGTYTLQYRTRDNSTFSESDWDGTSDEGWTNAESYEGSLDDVTAFRIIIDASGAQGEAWMPSGSTVRVTFDAKVKGKAQPADIAVNSFGYHYKIRNNPTELDAMPGPVTVQVPSVPTLQKRVVDRNNAQIEKPVQEDTTFYFVMYSGKSEVDLSGVHGETPAELIASLNGKMGASSWRLIGLEVKANDSQSEKLELSNEVMNVRGGQVLEGSGDDWSWTQGGTYRVVELPTGDDYSFWHFNSNTSSTYAFTYDQAKNEEMLCSNKNNTWSLTVNKKDALLGSPLQGAVFGLYSPNNEDALTPDEINAINGEICDLLEETVRVGAEGKTYYLAGYADMRETPNYTWTELTRDNYYLLEVKAPDGYALPDAGQLVYRASDTDQDGEVAIEVKNFNSFTLPSTGGPGTTLFTLGGVALMGAACIAGYRKRSRKGDGPCC